MIDINKDIIYFAAYLLLHGLIAWRLWQGLTGRMPRRIMLFVLALGFLAMALQLGEPAGIWQGTVLFATLLVPLDALLCRILRERHQDTMHIVLLMVLLFSVLIAWMNGRALPRFMEEKLVLREWPGNRPYRLIVLSDLHAKSAQQGRMGAIVGMINSRDADWVVFCGDLAVGLDWPWDLAPAFRGIRARHGVFAVRGNHEIREGGVSSFRAFCQEAGIVPLVNEARESRGLYIAGVDEAILKGSKGERARWNRPGGDLKQTLEGIAPNRPIILLAHRSAWAYQAEKAGVDLMLCGHTHGGQLPPISWLVSALDPYSSGGYRLGGMELRVSEGAGVWDYLPMRLFTQNSIHEIVISGIRD